MDRREGREKLLIGHLQSMPSLKNKYHGKQIKETGMTETRTMHGGCEKYFDKFSRTTSRDTGTDGRIIIKLILKT